MKSLKRSIPIAVVVVFAIVTQVGAQTGGLSGTSWQLVQIQNADGTSERPDDPANFSVEFGADGSVIARLDCNRGHGAWKSAAPGQIELAPMALTRVMCLHPELSDRMARDWSSMQSYAIEDGHLRLTLSTGGYYEFELFVPPSPEPSPGQQS
ncbi:MAG TPA: META domain-containing protein [Candidatus Cybelea sp.]